MREDRSGVGVEIFRPDSLRAAAAEVAAGRVSCVELVERCLARAQATEAVVHAFLRLDPQAALEQARALDAELAAGGHRGPLHGIPVAVKDVIDVAGLTTTAASRVLAPDPARRDAEIVAALRTAGAVVLGKANTHEFANGATTPPTRNPVDPGRIAGGSSGGSAAAVAAGSALAAVGTDTGGSVRLPAALCGVAGFRPRRGSGPGMGGIIPLAPEFDQWGLLAPTAADLALVWTAIHSRPVRVAAARELCLVVPDHLDQVIPDLAADVAGVFEATVDAMMGRGARVVRARMPDLARWRPPRMAIQMRQLLDGHRAAGWWPGSRSLYSDEVRLNLEAAEAQAAVPLDAARAQLAELDRAVDALLGPDRLLALPTVPVTAPGADEVASMPRGDGARHPIVGRLAAVTLPFGRPSLASVTLPCGRTADRLPVGLQLVGTADGPVLGAAIRFEEERTWDASTAASRS